MAWKFDGICKIKSVGLSFELVGLLVDESTGWRGWQEWWVVGLAVDELASWRVDKLASWPERWFGGLVGCRVDKLTGRQKGWCGGFGNWRDGKLTRWQVDELTSWRVDKKAVLADLMRLWVVKFMSSCVWWVMSWCVRGLLGLVSW